MSLLNTLVDFGKSALNSDAGKSLIDAGVEAGTSKLLNMDGFDDIPSSSPTTPLQPKPEPEAKSVTDEAWFWPAVVGVVVVAVVFIFTLGRTGKK